MKFIISSQTLLKSLQNVSGIISTNPTLMIASNFYFRLQDNTLHITATDIDTMMTTFCEVSQGEGEGGVCIPSKILLDYLKSLPEQPLNFAIDEEFNIEIHSDNGQYKLKGQDPDNFPKAVEIDNPQSLMVPSHVLNDGISYTLFCVANDEMKKNMSGVYMEVVSSALTFVSTDMQRLVRYAYPSSEYSSDIAGVIVPKKPLQQLNSILDSNNSEIEILFNDQFFMVKNEVIELRTRLIDGKFPDYQMVIPKNPSFGLEVNKNDLEGALKRVNIFANKSTNQITMDISSNKIKLQAEDIDFSYQGDETIPCVYDGDDIKLSFNARLLIELIHHMPGDSIKIGLSTPTKPVLFEPGDDSDEDTKDDLLMLNMPLVL